jgi:hypothetical protein
MEIWVQFEPSGLSLRAVNRIKSNGRPIVLGIRLDRFDHQLEFVGAVDLARNEIAEIWLHAVGFGEVVQAINGMIGMVELEEDRTASSACHLE